MFRAGAEKIIVFLAIVFFSVFVSSCSANTPKEVWDSTDRQNYKKCFNNKDCPETTYCERGWCRDIYGR